MRNLKTCALVLLLSIASAFAIGFFPQTAYAWLDDVTDSYPASQQIPITGDVLTGADVPEGVYSSTADTSSYMCKMTDVSVTSAGGELWVTFTLSKAYNALYFGTAEEAASLSGEDGDDYSPYITVDPVEGYVARVFSLPIPALNYEFTLAVFSGGSKGTDKGLWYTRTVVVHSSQDIDDAIAGGGSEDDPSGGGDSEGDDPSDGGADDGGSDEGTTPADEGDDGDSGSSDDDSKDSDNDDDAADDDDDDDDKSSDSSKKTTPSSSNNTASAATASDDGSDDQAAQQESAPTSKTTAKKAKKGVKVGKLISVVDPNQVVVQQSLPEIEAQQLEDEQKQGNMTAVAAGMAVANVALAGAFVVGVRNARPRRRILP